MYLYAFFATVYTMFQNVWKKNLLFFKGILTETSRRNYRPSTEQRHPTHYGIWENWSSASNRVSYGGPSQFMVWCKSGFFSIFSVNFSIRPSLSEVWNFIKLIKYTSRIDKVRIEKLTGEIERPIDILHHTGREVSHCLGLILYVAWTFLMGHKTIEHIPCFVYFLLAIVSEPTHIYRCEPGTLYRLNHCQKRDLDGNAVSKLRSRRAKVVDAEGFDDVQTTHTLIIG